MFVVAFASSQTMLSYIRTWLLNPSERIRLEGVDYPCPDSSQRQYAAMHPRKQYSLPLRKYWTWIKVKVVSSRTATILWYLNIGLAFLVLGCFLLLLDIRTKIAPPASSSGYSDVALQWRSPNQTENLLSKLNRDLSSNIQPIPCHSHNDYSRTIPLFDALAAGCTGVEADIWLDSDAVNSSELLVGHARKALTSDRTLRSLYVDPLLSILQHQNKGLPTDYPRAGVYDVNPNATLVLMLDFKEKGDVLWPLVQEHLTPLRENGYLRYWNGSAIVPGPITIVGSGEVPFNLITANSSYCDIFFDAPLVDLENSSDYNITNSYYASVALSEDIGTLWGGRLSSKQRSRIDSQIETARSRELLPRYWSTPEWPISLRNRVWTDLVGFGVGMLNADDLVTASRWNWDYCTVLGMSLCG